MAANLSYLFNRYLFAPLSPVFQSLRKTAERKSPVSALLLLCEHHPVLFSCLTLIGIPLGILAAVLLFAFLFSLLFLPFYTG